MLTYGVKGSSSSNQRFRTKYLPLIGQIRLIEAWRPTSRRRAIADAVGVEIINSDEAKLRRR